MKSKKIDAFLSQINSGKRVTDKIKILKIIKENPVTLENLISLGFKIQTASARCSELEEMGYIKKVYDPNKKYSLFRFVETAKEREDLRIHLKNAKKKNYFDKGLKLGYIYFDDNGNLKTDFKK